MHQRRWIKLFCDYNYKIRYHLCKENVAADVLSRKERIKPKRVRSMNMTLQSSINSKILVAQKEASDESAGLKKGLDEMIEYRKDRALYYLDRIWVSLKGDVRTLIMDEAYKLKYFVHQELIRCIMILGIGTKLDMSTAYHPHIDGQSECTIQTLEDMLRACVLDFRGSWDVHLPLVEFSYNNSYHSSVRCALFKALYGGNCRLLIMLKAARDHKKSYANKRRKPFEFSVGVVCFGKKGKLASRFAGPFEITEQIGPVAYKLRLLENLNGVHETFHMSNLKKCLANPTLQVPLDDI
uniref:Putative reverse transcriptase domain-containing protein n=1 Tax=Tanacetum cinerariifolium TaxID=118510 RepID=A0A6L2N9S0_TANCI|nr:putative reverse transcriptase domain-containing protein [Tanacetum cinerariifolium]